MFSNTSYYLRPYATNSFGTQYRAELTVKTLEKITDIDGNTYNIAAIGTQIWMAENLKTTRYKDGTSIPNVTSSWANLITPGYCWYSNNAATYKNLYGALYNWYAVNTGNLCPAGWHVPTNDNLVTLLIYAGGDNISGTKLKETGTTHWNSPNVNTTNETLFTALPGGQLSGSSFGNVGVQGTFWSSTVYETENIYTLQVEYNYQGATRYTYYKRAGVSVRCIKD